MDVIKLSIITPVFNNERFIEECIKNVIEQRCPEAEHIIIDGASSDKTVGIIRRYAEKYPHIRWISEKDTGQADAMNKGILMAKGRIISILNADDFYEPHVLNEILNIFESIPEPSLVVGNLNIWDDEEKIAGVNKPKKLKFEDLMLWWGINPAPMNPSSYFYHKSLHQKTGMYDVNLQYSMDTDFLLKAVQEANVKYIDKVWGNCRYIKGSKTFENPGFREHPYIFGKYRGQLPLFQRWCATIMYMYSRSVLRRKIKHYYSRFIYYIRNPREAVRYMKKMVQVGKRQ